MKIAILESVATYHKGRIYEVADEEGLRLLKDGSAKIAGVEYATDFGSDAADLDASRTRG